MSRSAPRMASATRCASSCGSAQRPVERHFMHPVQGRTFNSPTPNHSMSHPSGNASHTWASICETTPPRRGLPFRTTVFILRFPTLVSVIYFQYVPEIPAAAHLFHPPASADLLSSSYNTHNRSASRPIPGRGSSGPCRPCDLGQRRSALFAGDTSDCGSPPSATRRHSKHPLFFWVFRHRPPPDNEQSFRPARRAEKSRPAPHRQTVRKAKTAPPCAGRAERAAARIRNKPPPFINARPRSVRTPRNPPFPPQG